MLPLTLLLMQRLRTNTVTGIPILIPCGESEQQGVATWLGDVRQVFTYVRVVTQDDLAPNSKRNPIRSVSESDREFFLAVVALIKGLGDNDRLAIAKARERVVLALGRKQGVDPNSDDVRRVASELGLEAGQEAVAMELFTIGPGQAVDVGWLFSSVVSGELDSVRLVLWWHRKQFRPALYCPDLKSALFTLVLMKIVSGRGWGVCPQCGDFYVQKRPDQTYCTVAHREAHRVARWRAAKLAKTRTRGGKHGTR
jgi:hypothetical protein